MLAKMDAKALKKTNICSELSSIEEGYGSCQMCESRELTISDLQKYIVELETKNS
jgi:hypothetical protein